MSRADEQAFPVPAVPGLPNGNVEWGSSGLTIREHFAAMAMQGLLVSYGPANHTPAHVAQWSCEYADALIAELAKPVTP